MSPFNVLRLSEFLYVMVFTMHLRQGVAGQYAMPLQIGMLLLVLRHMGVAGQCAWNRRTAVVQVRGARHRGEELAVQLVRVVVILRPETCQINEIC